MEVKGLSTGQDEKHEKRSLILTKWPNVKENQKPIFADIVWKQKTYPKWKKFLNDFVRNILMKKRQKYLKNALRDRLTRLE